ncbi:MAG: T9SS C-terminal target domain-containing protein, partial [Chitinophagia bacterium]|nr:T9SS C-terminal target domain-containing protein [Chitinophagia bacterium]
MKVRLGLLLLWLCCGVCVRAQYAPQVGIAGSTALPATSPLFTQWARGCTLERGYKFLDSLSMGYVSTGDSSLALGMADRNVVSLGDSGIAVLTFPGYIYDGAGADFAVFENGFANPTNDSQAFLELAFVEVSSDSTNFYRFPAHSNTPLTTQIPGAGVYMYADKIHNLAGKYIAQFGTPFDLADLSSIPTLDVNHIVKVRLIDVVGDIRQHICRDSGGTTINDPYPTPFAGG